MSQQKPAKSADDVYKKQLFYDNGIRYVPVRGRLTAEYKPPSPVLRSQAQQTIQSSSGLVSMGTAHYAVSLQYLFYSKEEFSDWLQFAGAEHKFYDEKGTIYLGVLAESLDIAPVEQESKYLVSATLLMIKKQDFEFRAKHEFIDVHGHWAEKYIDEMMQRGLVSAYDYNGEPIQYFQPEVYGTRAHAVQFITRTYKYIDKLLRGF